MKTRKSKYIRLTKVKEQFRLRHFIMKEYKGDSTYQILIRIKEQFRCVHCNGVDRRPHIFCHYCNNTGMCGGLICLLMNS